VGAATTPSRWDVARKQEATVQKCKTNLLNIMYKKKFNLRKVIATATCLAVQFKNFVYLCKK